MNPSKILLKKCSWELWMANLSDADQGIRLLIQKFRTEFRRPENINYYTENDFKEAEKKFVKFCLTGNPNYNSD